MSKYVRVSIYYVVFLGIHRWTSGPVFGHTWTQSARFGHENRIYYWILYDYFDTLDIMSET